MNPLNSLAPTPENVMWAIGGMLSVQAWQWIKCKYKDHRDPEGKPHVFKKLNWFYVWTAVVLATLLFVNVQNQNTYNYALQLAREVKACNTEFQRALVASKDLNAEDRKLMVDWQQATFERARQLAYLADTYGAASPNYAVQKGRVDGEYFKAITEIEQRRVENERARQASPPYPEPTCGK